jgi:hypothetical protein
LRREDYDEVGGQAPMVDEHEIELSAQPSLGLELSAQPSTERKPHTHPPTICLDDTPARAVGNRDERKIPPSKRIKTIHSSSTGAPIPHRVSHRRLWIRSLSSPPCLSSLVTWHHPRTPRTPSPPSSPGRRALRSAGRS